MVTVRHAAVSIALVFNSILMIIYWALVIILIRTSPTKYAAYTSIDFFAATLTVPSPGQDPYCNDEGTVFRPAEENLSKLVVPLPEEQGANFLEDDVVPPSVLDFLKSLPAFADVNLEQCQFEEFATRLELPPDRMIERRSLSGHDAAQHPDVSLLSRAITDLDSAGSEHAPYPMSNTTLSANSTCSTDAGTPSAPLTSSSNNSITSTLVTDIHESSGAAAITSLTSDLLSNDLDSSLIIINVDLASNSSITAQNARDTDTEESSSDIGSITSSMFASNQIISPDIATTNPTATINRAFAVTLVTNVVILYLPNNSYILVPAPTTDLSTTFNATRTTITRPGRPPPTDLDADVTPIAEEVIASTTITDNIQTITDPAANVVFGSDAAAVPFADVEDILGADDPSKFDPGKILQKVTQRYLTKITGSAVTTRPDEERVPISAFSAGIVPDMKPMKATPTKKPSPVRTSPLPTSKPSNEAISRPTRNPSPKPNPKPSTLPIPLDKPKSNPSMGDQPAGAVSDKNPPQNNPPPRSPLGGDVPGNPRPNNSGANRPDRGGSSPPEVEPVFNTPNVIIVNPPRQSPAANGGNVIGVAGGDTPNPAPAIQVPSPPVSQTLTVADQTVVIAPAPPTAAPGGDRGGGEGIIFSESQIVTPGQQATINGIPVSFNAESSALVVQGSSTIIVSPSPVVNSPELVIDVGGEDITVSLAPPVDGQAGGIIIDGTQTLAPGQATQLGDTTISVPQMGSAIVIDSNTIPLTNQASATVQTIAIGSSSLLVTPQESGGGLVIEASQTLVPGGVLNINGVPVSLPVSGSSIVIGGSQTVQITGGTGPLLTAQPVLSVGDESFTAMVEGGTTQFVLGSGITLIPGGVVTLDGTIISLPTSPTVSEVIIDGTTSAFVSPALVTPAPPLIVDGEIFTAVTVGTVVGYEIADGQTLLPGGIAIIDGTTVSLPAAGLGNSVVIIDGATSTFTDTPFVTPPPITINGQIFTATVIDESSTIYSIAPGTTLTPGGVITVDGTTISLPAGASDNSVLIFNGVTSTIPDVLNITPPPAITVDDDVFSATVIGSSTYYSFGPDITLTPGGVVTVDGTRISLVPDATAVIYEYDTGSDSTTSALVDYGPFETNASGNVVYDGGAVPASCGPDITHWLAYVLSMLFGVVLLL